MIKGTNILEIREDDPILPASHTKYRDSSVTPRMLRQFLILVLILPACASSAQLGVNLRYLSGQSDILDEQNISQKGLKGSLEYHFRLKEKRLEFHPGLGYRFTYNDPGTDGHWSAVDLDLNTSIYPFDFGGDCDCPTFSKEGNLVKKGFFLEVSPGASYQILKRLRSTPGDPSRLPIRSKNLIWKIGGAAGLDIGVTEQFTLTPMFSVTWLSASEWEGLLSDGGTGNLDDYTYLGAGLRLTYNADPKRRRR